MFERYLPPSLLLWLPALYLLLAPNTDLISNAYFTFYDEQRFFEIALLGITALVLAMDSVSRKAWLQVFSGFSWWTKTALSVFFFLGALSAVFSAPLPKYAWQELSLFALLFILAVAIAAQIRLHGERMRLFLVFAIFASGMLVTWRMLLDYLVCLRYGPGCLNLNDYFYHFVNVRFFNQFQSWTFPMLALPFLLYSERSGRWRVLLFLPAVFWWVLWIYSGGRGTGLAMLTGSLVVGIIFRKRALPWLFFQGRTLLAGGILYFLMFYLRLQGSGLELVSGLSRFSRDSLVVGRLDMWLASLNMALTHPLLGVGPQQYAFHPVHNIAHPHNAFLQLLAEWGIPAFAAFLFLLISGFFVWIRNVAKRLELELSGEYSSIPVALTASFVGACVHAQVSGILVMPLSQVTGVVILGLMLSFGPEKTPLTVPCRQRWHALMFSLGVLSLTTVLLWSLFPEVSYLSADKARYVQSHPGEVYHPRFWNQGLIDLHGSR